MCATFRASEPTRSDPVLISSRRNPLVRQLRQLHTPAGRREAGLLLIEGTHLAQEVARLGLKPHHLLCSEAWQQRQPALMEALQAALGEQGQRLSVSEEVLAAIATTEHPDGVLLTLPPPPAPPPQRVSFGLVLDGIQDPGNLGTLQRTALAAGIEQLWLAGGADPHQPKVLRASAGAALELPCWRAERTAVAARVHEAAGRGLQVVAALPPAGNGLPYWELDWTRPSLLLLGAEGPGLSPELLALATHRVGIPHSRAVESLNVAVAAAPLLLERTRQERMPVN
ncbi:MAG: RNA methyltransferase [Cyanobacteria bacterium K_Offshore_0m_m2_072]|nr:RNA methyltransferase [Cyanobacteria bacterium K_Offshore_0m_m2_072]